MGYFWEPKWIRKKLEIAPGIYIETCVDLSTGLILCPLCANIEEICPSSDNPSTTIPKGGLTYFFSISDLLNHIRAHGEASWRTKVEEEEIEEEIAGQEELEE